MSETLYIQTEQNVEVHDPHVYLGNIAKLSSSDEKVLSRNRGLLVMSIPKNEPGRYVISAMDIIEKVQKKETNVDVVHIGEPNFILTYEKEKRQHRAWSWIKTAVISIITFFGAGFSIMTFNTDVDTSGLFTKIYEQFTGETSDGFTELELMYSIGIGIGVVFFFNHFGTWKITQDPTPMEVQMRVYEEDVNRTVMEKNNREGRKGDGD